MNNYQEAIKKYRLPTADNTYVLINLAGEVGELCSLVAKARRDKNYPEEYLTNIRKELGDILWHVAAFAADYGISLQDVANANLYKLEDRFQRNVIEGSGDDR